MIKSYAMITYKISQARNGALYLKQTTNIMYLTRAE